MIAKLTGILDTLSETSLILDVSGVGYSVYCSSRTLASLGQKGDQVSLCIETIMRAENLQLYGFKDEEEQSCFRLLITIQGVGVRMALALLSALSPQEIYQAIATQDKPILTRAEGVGAKLAGRIVAELKDKVPSEMGFASNLNSSSSISPQEEEAVSALVNLGYRRLEAATAIHKARGTLGENSSLNELIRLGLSHLSRTGS